MLGVWIPVFCIGFFVWDMPVALHRGIAHPDAVVRIRIRAVRPPIALCGAAALGAACSRSQHAAVLAVVVIAGIRLRRRAMTSIGSQYPDHRGAAQFMRTQNITPDDIVIAEDVLQQTYYLGLASTTG